MVEEYVGRLSRGSAECCGCSDGSLSSLVFRKGWPHRDPKILGLKQDRIISLTSDLPWGISLADLNSVWLEVIALVFAQRCHTIGLALLRTRVILSSYSTHWPEPVTWPQGTGELLVMIGGAKGELQTRT